MNIFSTKTILSDNFQQIEQLITHRKDKLSMLWQTKCSTNKDARLSLLARDLSELEMVDCF